MAPRAVTAGGAGIRCLSGSTAAGVAEFLGGRAFFPVADARLMLVRLTTGAGVFGGVFYGFNGIFLSDVGCVGWFLHSGTFGFLIV